MDDESLAIFASLHCQSQRQELETKISCARSLADYICTVSPLRQLEERLQVLLWLSLNAGDLPWFLRELLAQVQSALRQLPQEQTATERLGQRCDELLAETAQLLSNVEQYATFGESVVPLIEDLSVSSYSVGTLAGHFADLACLETLLAKYLAISKDWTTHVHLVAPLCCALTPLLPVLGEAAVQKGLVRSIERKQRQDSIFYWLQRWIFCCVRRHEETMWDPDLSKAMLAPKTPKTKRSVRSSMLAQKVSSVFQVFCSLLGHLKFLGDVAEEACGMVTPWSTWVLQVRCALVQLLAMFDSLSKSTKLQLEVLSELCKGDMTRETLKSSLQIAASNLSKLSDFRCQVTAKSCECEKLMNLFSNNDQIKMQHAVMRIIELYGAVGHRNDASDASLNAEVAVALAAKHLAEATAEELHKVQQRLAVASHALQTTRERSDGAPWFQELQHLLQALPGLLAEKGIEDSIIFECLRGGLMQHELLCRRLQVFLKTDEEEDPAQLLSDVEPLFDAYLEDLNSSSRDLEPLRREVHLSDDELWRAALQVATPSRRRKTSKLGQKILFRSLSFWRFPDSLNAVLCFLGRDGSRTRNSAYWIVTLENCCSFHDVLDVHVVHDD